MDHARALVVLLLVVADSLGAVDGSTPGPPRGDRLSYETYGFGHASPEPAIDGGVGYPTDGDEPPPFYVTVVASADVASRFDPAVAEPAAERFVGATEFDRQFLVVVESFPASSEPDYRVDRLEWTDDGIHPFVDDSSDGDTTDVTVETLPVRVDPVSSSGRAQ